MVDGLSDSVGGSSESRWIPEDVLKLRDAWPIYGTGASAVRMGREILSGFWIERSMVAGLKCGSRVVSRSCVTASLLAYSSAWVIGGAKLYDVVRTM